MFPIQTYTKFALSAAYFPAAEPAAAARRLSRWIKQNTGLCNALAETGYRKTQHHFNARQTKLIFDFLGEP